MRWGGLGNEIHVEPDQRVADRDALTELHQRLETLALHGDGVQPDVHQDLRAAVAPHGDGVTGGMHLGHLAVARRDQCGGGVEQGNEAKSKGEQRNGKHASARQAICQPAQPGVDQSVEQPGA